MRHRDRRPPARDDLKHFDRDGPGVRLFALFLCKLPWIISSCGGLAVSLVASRVLGWW